jgi:hypothetical protein
MTSAFRRYFHFLLCASDDKQREYEHVTSGGVLGASVRSVLPTTCMPLAHAQSWIHILVSLLMLLEPIRRRSGDSSLLQRNSTGYAACTSCCKPADRTRSPPLLYKPEVLLGVRAYGSCCRSRRQEQPCVAGSAQMPVAAGLQLAGAGRHQVSNAVQECHMTPVHYQRQQVYPTDDDLAPTRQNGRQHTAYDPEPFQASLRKGALRS